MAKMDATYFRYYKNQVLLQNIDVRLKRKISGLEHAIALLDQVVVALQEENLAVTDSRIARSNAASEKSR